MKKTVVLRLERLREDTQALKDYQRHSLKELKENRMLRQAVERSLQQAIECIIDIGELLISHLRLPRPENSYGVIIALGEKGVIPKGFARRFAPVTGFRNILVHEYLKIDIEKVYRHLQKDLKDFDRFARSIAQYVKKI